MNLVNGLVAVIFLHIIVVAGELYRDDVCPLKDGGNGICKIISDCPAAIADLGKGVFPQQCGFEGTQSIVCCLQPKPVTTTTKRTTTTPRMTTRKATTKPRPVVTLKPTAPSPGKSRLPGEIANYKCIEYSQYVYTVELNPLLVANADDIRRNECPFNRQELVVGGEAASRREFPHMVQFGYDGSDGLKWTCGGSLLSDQYVLTAAHCLSDRSLGDAKYARMGIVDLEDDTQDHIQQFNVSERIPHPNHAAPSHYNDIGLVKLNGKVELNTWVRPACLYTNNASPWSNVIASGWGKVDFAGAESSVLLRVVLELFGQPACNKTYRQQAGSVKLKDGIRDDIMICAGHSTELKDTCQGDSGGPLQVYRNGEKELSCMYEVVGVTSFGKACGIAPNIPAVYTRVSYYTKWIEDIVWPLT